jgi:hypothetical protein
MNKNCFAFWMNVLFIQLWAIEGNSAGMAVFNFAIACFFLAQDWDKP